MDREREMAGSLERRDHPRQRVALVARLEGGGKSRLAVTQDISRGGALLFAAGAFEPGEAIALTVVAERTEHEFHLHARVLRAVPRSERPWRCALAVQFDEALSLETALLVGPLI